MNKGELHRQATDFYGTYCRDVECDLDAVASYPLDRIQLISIAINYCDWGSSAIDRPISTRNESLGEEFNLFLATHHRA